MVEVGGLSPQNIYFVLDSLATFVLTFKLKYTQPLDITTPNVLLFQYF